MFVYPPQSFPAHPSHRSGWRQIHQQGDTHPRGKPLVPKGLLSAYIPSGLSLTIATTVPLSRTPRAWVAGRYSHHASRAPGRAELPLRRERKDRAQPETRTWEQLQSQARRTGKAIPLPEAQQVGAHHPRPSPRSEQVPEGRSVAAVTVTVTVAVTHRQRGRGGSGALGAAPGAEPPPGLGQAPPAAAGRALGGAAPLGSAGAQPPLLLHARGAAEPRSHPGPASGALWARRRGGTGRSGGAASPGPGAVPRGCGRAARPAAEPSFGLQRELENRHRKRKGQVGVLCSDMTSYETCSSSV